MYILKPSNLTNAFLELLKAVCLFIERVVWRFLTDRRLICLPCLQLRPLILMRSLFLSPILLSFSNCGLCSVLSGVFLWLRVKTAGASPGSKGIINTLTIPIWFIVLVSWLLCFRVYAKLTQREAPSDNCVAWITPVQLEQMSQKPGGIKKDLVMYEFTADWCPPCKKRERTVFRAPKVISEINNNFVPVRVDLD
jgi:thiol:disulfide interchange protein